MMMMRMVMMLMMMIHTYIHTYFNFVHHRMLLLGVVEIMMRWIRRLNSISGMRRGRMPVGLRY